LCTHHAPESEKESAHVPLIGVAFLEAVQHIEYPEAISTVYLRGRDVTKRGIPKQTTTTITRCTTCNSNHSLTI